MLITMFDQPTELSMMAIIAVKIGWLRVWIQDKAFALLCPLH